MILIDHGVKDRLVDTMRLCWLEDYKGDDQEVCKLSVVFDTISDKVDFDRPVHVWILVVLDIQETFKDP